MGPETYEGGDSIDPYFLAEVFSDYFALNKYKSTNFIGRHGLTSTFNESFDSAFLSDIIR